MRVPAAAVLAFAGIVTLSCGGINDPSKNTVETFSGTLEVGGLKVHSFSASKAGEISVKLTALAPTSNAALLLSWTQASGDSCGGLLQQNFAQLNVPAIAGAIISGRYCIVVQDIGAIAVPQTYTISVSHP